MSSPSPWLATLTTTELASELQAAQGRSVILVPVGSTEPHGPHLPLSTDVLISEGVCSLAATELTTRGYRAWSAPSMAYGVTHFAQGFAGALSIPAEVLTSLAAAIVRSLLALGVGHVCLVNNHLEPEHDQALRAALEGLAPERATLVSPLTRALGRQLTEEYRSGACHAGRYETSLVLALQPDLVRLELAHALPALTTSLSTGIRQGQRSFQAMGLDRAYTGDPASASSEEGQATVRILASYVVETVLLALSNLSAGEVEPEGLTTTLLPSMTSAERSSAR